MPAAEHAPAFHVQNLVTMLIEHFPIRAHQTHVGFAAHGPGFGDEVLQAQGVTGKDRLHPFHVFKTWRAQAGCFMQEIGHHQPHGHGASVPTTGTQAAKNRTFGGFFIQMKILWIELPCKSQDFFFAGRDRAQVPHLTGLQVFPISLDAGHQRPPDTSRKLIVV